MHGWDNLSLVPAGEQEFSSVLGCFLGCFLLPNKVNEHHLSRTICMDVVFALFFLSPGWALVHWHCIAV